MSKKITGLRPKRVLTALLRAGFYVHHQTGSHVQLHSDMREHARVTIPMHTRFDLPPDVVQSIIKQAGLTRDEFLDLL